MGMPSLLAGGRALLGTLWKEDLLPVPQLWHQNGPSRRTRGRGGTFASRTCSPSALFPGAVSARRGDAVGAGGRSPSSHLPATGGCWWWEQQLAWGRLTCESYAEMMPSGFCVLGLELVSPTLLLETVCLGKFRYQREISASINTYS